MEIQNKNEALKSAQAQILELKQNNMYLQNEIQEIQNLRDRFKLENSNNNNQLKEEISKNYQLSS